MSGKHWMVYDPDDGTYLIVKQVRGDLPPSVEARGLSYVIASAAVKALNE